MSVEQTEIQSRRIEVDSRPCIPNPPPRAYLGGEIGWISTALKRRRRGKREKYLQRYIESIARDAPEAEKSPYDDLKFDSTGIAETDGLVIYDSDRNPNPFGVPRDLPVE